MRLVGFLQDGRRYIGSLEDGRVTSLGSVEDFYRDPDAATAAGGGSVYDLADLEQVPFVPETSRIFCVGVNYADHAEEARAAGQAIPTIPMIFGRWQQSLVLTGEAVPVPVNEPGLDWEVELAAVIGKKIGNVQAQDALDGVLGYTAFNDLSARHKQLATSQFTLGKNADRSGPIGPVLVTADEFPEPLHLDVSTRVNGEVMQQSNTKHMTHDVAAIIAYISDTVTLLPGDVIATGTPSGVGAAMDPPRFLVPGDQVEVTVEGIGSIVTPIVATSTS
jgi:2,4-didehydro-3-deoxy-L-rhamnonate hydrolase